MFHWLEKRKDWKKSAQGKKASQFSRGFNGLRPREISRGFESLESRQLLSALGWEVVAGGWGPAMAASSATSSTKTTATPTVQVSTTTALTASNTSPDYGQNVTLTATVTTGSGNVTGLVQFFDNSSGSPVVIGTAQVRHGVATLQVGNLSPGTVGHGITAEFMGSDAYASSTSSAVTVTVRPTPTVTLLTSSGNPVATGEPLTFLAQVSPNYNSGSATPTANASRLAGFLGGLFGRGEPGGQSNGLAPTGTVAFQYTVGTGTTAVTTTLGTAVLENGQAELTLSAATLAALPADLSISAVYTSSDGNYVSSNSQTVSESQGSTLASARVFVQGTHNITAGTAATLSVTLRAAKSSTAAFLSTDTVTLYDATTGALLTPSSGSASTNTNPVALTPGSSTSSSAPTATGSFSTTFTTSGLHLIIATFSGDTNYAAEEVIIPVYVQSGSASSGAGGFEGGGFGAPSIGLQSHGSSKPVSATQAATSVALATSDSGPNYGQNVTLTATVTTASGKVSGLVQFSEALSGGSYLVIGTAGVHNGVATLQIGTLPVGSYNLVAQYMGNANYLASPISSPATAVTINEAPTITLLSYAPSPVDTTGQALTLTAQVLPDYNSSVVPTATEASRMPPMIGLEQGGWGGFGLGGSGGQLSNGNAPSGTVTFQYTVSSGTTTSSTVATVLGTAELLNNGEAQLTLSQSALNALPAGAVISAFFTPTLGDGNYGASSSQSIAPSISSTLSATRLSVEASRPVTEGVSTTLSLTVGPGGSSTATAAPTGTVTLYDATTQSALTSSSTSVTNPVTLTAGTTKSTASFPVTFTTPGLHLIIATYSGDSNYAGQEVIIPIYVGSGSSSGGGGDNNGGGGGGWGGFGGGDFGGGGFGGGGFGGFGGGFGDFDQNRHGGW